MTQEAVLLHDLPLLAARRRPHCAALHHGSQTVTYQALADAMARFAAALSQLGIRRGERVAVFLDKRQEAVVAAFGSTLHGAVFVPVNPVLKPEQVVHILRDCSVRLLVTGAERLQALLPALAACTGLRHVLLAGVGAVQPRQAAFALHGWGLLEEAAPQPAQRAVETDMAAIFYTSGSTGRPKGVVLSHRNLVAGAQSVAAYLGNQADDVLLAALPLSFDAGFSQLTTAFHAGASVVLLDYLLPRDLVRAVAAHRVSGLTAVPALWMQLAQAAWSEEAARSLRYFANTGGRMPAETLARLRALLPNARPYLMYGLTEAFRATYLPPEEADRRPSSIGKAIPNSEVLVLRPDGTPCEPFEPGELVQRGPLVAQGYWNDPDKTAERFRPLPGRDRGLVLPELAVFSGDTVFADDEGFLYFVGRRDEMIKSSGYRISPTEVEEVVHATQLVAECAAFGVPHAALGEAVVLAVCPREAAAFDGAALAQRCREGLPGYMVPLEIEVRESPLPRNPNGKIDRRALAAEHAARQAAQRGQPA